MAYQEEVTKLLKAYHDAAEEQAQYPEIVDLRPLDKRELKPLDPKRLEAWAKAVERMYSISKQLSELHRTNAKLRKS